MHRVAPIFRRARRMAALPVVAALCLAAGPALAIDPLIHKAIADKSVPSCADSPVIDTIQSRFSSAAPVARGTSADIASVGKVTETHAGQLGPSPTLRRYCTAEARLSDGHRTTLYYLVEQGAGYASATWNVDFCLAGFDPWRVHDGRCHSVRPRWW